MDQAATEAVRRYVSNGGTVVMTAFPDKVDETAPWYGTPLPGAWRTSLADQDTGWQDSPLQQDTGP